MDGDWSLVSCYMASPRLDTSESQSSNTKPRQEGNKPRAILLDRAATWTPLALSPHAGFVVDHAFESRMFHKGICPATVALKNAID